LLGIAQRREDLGRPSLVEWVLNGAVSTEDGVKSNEKSGKKHGLTVV
jgi:hypothetical protein